MAPDKREPVLASEVQPTPPPSAHLDDIIAEEKSHLKATEREAATRGTPVNVTSVAHAKDQLHRAEAISYYHKLLAQGSEFRTHLLSMAAHEIKAPLGALAIEIHLMTEFPGPAEKHQRSLGSMQRTVNRMTTMLDNFLDLARVEGGRLTINPGKVDIGKLIQESVERFEGSAQTKKLKLESQPSEGLEGWGDEGRLVQVLSNLVSNGIRYSPPGGTIRVGANETPEHVEIYVQDTGIGFTTGQISQAFRPFVQVQGTPEETEGSGLGLYLSQAIVEAHGGRLWLESPGPGLGTRAAFTLPKNKASGLP